MVVDLPDVNDVDVGIMHSGGIAVGLHTLFTVEIRCM